ncbi:hypothetical protein N5F23_15130 [Pseudomonas sichuanensis]|uniref:hypothetical protein n=1 Tax=Pseudomonas sichuanensis TaxID=2213015 RepID=UPI00244C65BE|nr:hypothetical protein [Pseudomonas sichuanensis]MDH0731823.1 hypothetical protein [Pseudomonas sichuanensis]MDH1583911.1 hypothetical protein [Pseudomonas sichuanensis]MDH1592415.1 hypothetical protein [Pseudomonas sichuanensis]MDH1598166.1 hypothetical protein [Pseudomonas sichuanensis]
MPKRTDRSMRLLLSRQETQALRSILRDKPDQAAPRPVPKRLLCALGAVLLTGLVSLGLIAPELARAVAKWAGLVLGF